ncbi:XrtA/PEP-CTERM system histidine kinase PrsK [Qipengyuania sp.]|uniref:XrtA/PEP-CTERM system histidine kinase PrsK n=1 Tax=Qipengyuania sp. TaxID=2004515 RepID=UPI0035C84DF7
MTGVLALFLYGACAIGAGFAALAVLRRNARVQAERYSLVLALAVTAAWAVAVAALGVNHEIVWCAEALRNLAWLFTGYRMFANDGRHEAVAQVRPLVAALLIVESLQFILLGWREADGVLAIAALLRMMVSAGALVLLHNLYGGAADSSRRLLAWSCGGIAAFWAFELNLHTIAYLTGGAAEELNLLRALFAIGLVLAVGIGASVRAPNLAFRPSRALTFSTLSLGIVAIYFLTMIALANGVARFAGDLAQVTQVAFLLAAAALSLLWLPSERLRNLARTAVLKHLFRHRYDYRSVWLRFTRTISGAGQSTGGLHERAIRSLANMADSPSGLLLTPSDDGTLTLASRWQWATAEVPAIALPRALVRRIERDPTILDLDCMRADRETATDHVIPDWLCEENRAWAAIPLLHGEKLVGVVILARPETGRSLDWEDHDLLGIAGQQVASYLAEQASQEALRDAERFDEFNRRMAFVMHDIKNLSSQLGLLSRNAAKHADNPAFRDDMLITLRNSADKLDALVSRLGRYNASKPEQAQPVELVTLARELARRFASRREILVQGDRTCSVMSHRDTLEQALAHLIQNAVDASDANGTVTLSVRSSGLRGEISVIDTGAGMSAEFVRSGLFRPFVSTKGNGFGIGACEARELVLAMGGRLDVESREKLGSRFTVSFPLAEALRLRDRSATAAPKEEAA